MVGLLFFILVEILGQKYLKLFLTHLPLAFHFVCGPEGGAADKIDGKRKVSLCLVTPPQAAVVLNEISIVLNVRLTALNYGPRW